MKKRIMNVVNFVRGIEPRWETDLYTPVVSEIEVNKQYRIPATFLLQYDAMLREDFRQLFQKEKSEYIETGVWFENCRALIEKIGLQWRGREGYDWDWHVNPGFLQGYEPAQREAIIDEVFRLYRELFGGFPEVVGSWLLDAHSMRYMSEKYDIKAFCVCREQYGVDAYTLWGGYSNGGYYASKKNMLCPAQTETMQISTPVFRMLGADPIYSYDEKKYAKNDINVWTLEPGWYSGKDPRIVDWYFDTYYKTPCLTFSQATTGQENSFSWDMLREGYCMQMEKLAKLRDEGVLSLEKLGDTGLAFKKAYKLSPPQAQVALKDWDENGIKTVWYNCRYYRANLFLKDGELFFRDLQKYDEKYEERYLTTACEGWAATYDVLPLLDSRFWSEEENECRLLVDGRVKDIVVLEENETDLVVLVDFEDGKKGEIIFKEGHIIFKKLSLFYEIGGPKDCAIYAEENLFVYKHNGYSYQIEIEGEVSSCVKGWKWIPIQDELRLLLGK